MVLLCFKIENLFRSQFDEFRNVYKIREETLVQRFKLNEAHL